MWEHSHKPIEQYKRTLSLLVLITQNNFLPDEAASQVSRLLLGLVVKCFLSCCVSNEPIETLSCACSCTLINN